MTKPIWIAAMAVVGMAVVGLLLVGNYGGPETPGKRETLTLGSEPADDDDQAPTDDQTRDTHAVVNSAPSNERVQPVGASNVDGTRGTQDVSANRVGTSHLTRGTVSGGAGTVDTAPTSGVTRGTQSGGAGTHDGGYVASGGGGGDSYGDDSDSGGESTG